MPGKINPKQERFNILFNAQQEGKPLKPEHLQELERMKAEGYTITSGGAGGGGTTEGERKSSAFLTRALGANRDYETIKPGPRGLMAQKFNDIAPNLANVTINDGDRQVTDSAQAEFVAATLRYDSGAAIPPAELEAQKRIYFPQPGDGIEARNQKARARARAMQGLIESSGRALDPKIRDQYPEFFKDKVGAGVTPPTTGTPPPQTPPNSPAGGPPDETGKYAGSDIQMHMDSPENAQGYRFTPTQETALHEYLTSGKATPEGYGRMMTAFAAAQGVNVDDAYTQSATAQGQKLIEAAKAGKLGDGMSYNQSDKAYRESLLKEANAGQARETGELLTSGALAGGLDEARGIVGGASSLLKGDGFEKGYVHDRDLTRAVRDNAYEKRPIISGATEMLGALATPGGVSNEAVRGGSLAERMVAMGKAGRNQGIAAGYGYGEGTGGSLKGAVVGGATGMLIGGALPLASKPISAAYNFATKRPVIAGGQQIADAAAAENIPISRPFLDPSVRNKVTYLDTTARGAPIIQGALGDTANAIETRAATLGKGGNVVDAYEGGQAIQKAGKGYITRAKSLTDRLYDRAKSAVPEGVEIEPVQALATLDSHIAELNKSPAQNASEIKYLKAIRSDLTKQPVDTGLLDASGKPIFRPGEGLSIDTIRNMRTNMRGQISERNLTLSKAESRVIDVLGSASRDIQTQLAEKAPMAGARYARADAAFKGKQDKIKNVIQTFLGPRNANIPPEQAFSRLESMARSRGNSQGLQSMVGEMDKADVRDIAATFADSLGKDAAGDFSPARFIAHAGKLSPRARRIIFGDEGAETINNLVKVSNAFRKVSAMANHSGTERARNYRGAIGKVFGFVAGGAGGYSAGGGMGAAVGAMAASQAADAIGGIMNARSARALMSPNVAKWLKQTPTNPAAIESHIARLSTIAAREPAISGDVISLQNYLASKFSETPLASAAAPGQDRNDRRPPPENNGQ